MKNPTNTKTPEPVGAELVERPNDPMPEQVPYFNMDRLDEQAIIASYGGQPFRSMIYSLPFKDGKGKAPKNCGIPSCTYDGKHSHTHVTGVGIKGINEIVRQMGGIMVEIVEAKVVKHKGKPAFWAKAVARDQFTLTERFGENICPQYDQYGRENRFYIDIAKSKAERNAAKKIIPQLILEGLERLADTGKDVFEEADIEQIFKPFWTDRSRLKAAWFEKMTDRALNSPAYAKTSSLDAGNRGEAISEGSSGQKELPAGEDADTADSGSLSGPTKKQRGYMIGLIKKGEFTEDQAKEFIAAKATSFELASDYISSLKEGNYCDVTTWLELLPEDDNENQD